MRRAICSRKLFRATPSTAYENKSTNRNRTFHLLNKPDILTCYEHRNISFVAPPPEGSGAGRAVFHWPQETGSRRSRTHRSSKNTGRPCYSGARRPV